MQSNPPFDCNTKNNKKKVGKNVFAWFTRNKLIPKATIKLMQAFKKPWNAQYAQGGGGLYGPHTGMRRCTRYCSGCLYVQNTVYYFVRVCLDYIEGIACTNRVIKLRIFIFVLRRLE